MRKPSFLPLLALLTCAPDRAADPLQRDERPDVLLLTLDTTRADRLGCFGDAIARTPELDALAKESVRFPAARTPVPLTLPAHASLLTGRVPLAHGVHDNAAARLPDGAVTLAEVLAEGGWRTAAVIGAQVVARATGLGQGFATFDEDLPAQRGPTDMPQRGAQQVVDAALRAIDGGAAPATPDAAPLFLWCHFFDPHAPYAPPPRIARAWRERAAREPAVAALSEEERLYRGEIEAVDRAIGRLVREFGARRRARALLLVVTADHGEAFGEHSETTHGLLLHDATVRVPLLLRHPRLPPGSVAAPVSLVDVAPTVVELAGLAARPEAFVSGRSLAALLTDPGARDARDAPPSPPILIETQLPWHEFGWAWLEAVVVGDVKFVDAPHAELYDLAHDPAERENLAASQPDRVASMRRTLAAALEAAQRHELPASLRSEPAPATALLALGYATGTRPLPTRRDDLQDPKEHLDLVTLRDDGWSALAAGDLAGAEARFRELHARNRDKTVGAVLLAVCLSAQAELAGSRTDEPERRRLWSEAGELWAFAAGQRPQDASYRLNHAMALLELGQDEAAIGELQRCLEIAPDDPQTSFQLGVALSDRKDRDGARPHFARFLELTNDRDGAQAREARARLASDH